MAVIEGSKDWRKRVPDEYAIRCVERCKAKRKGNEYILKPKYDLDLWESYEYLVIKYVEPVQKNPELGFFEWFAIAKVWEGTKEILIAQNDLTSPPALLIKQEENWKLLGCLEKSTLPWNDVQPQISQVIHYSGKISETQKCDENAPEWLKEFAIEHNANVAYFRL